LNVPFNLRLSAQPALNNRASGTQERDHKHLNRERRQSFEIAGKTLRPETDNYLNGMIVSIPSQSAEPPKVAPIPSPRAPTVASRHIVPKITDRLDFTNKAQTVSVKAHRISPTRVAPIKKLPRIHVDRHSCFSRFPVWTAYRLPISDRQISDTDLDLI
jgi:hypothetical protein